MKIGILTFWKTEDNYGQLLQCYALQTFLRSLGHETFLIRTTNVDENSISIKQQLTRKARTVYRLYRYPFYLSKRVVSSFLYTLTHLELRKHVTNRGFEQFRNEYLHCTQVYTLKELQVNPPKADTFIVGSDQVWNTRDGIYYLIWSHDNIHKIAYAASFGGCDTLPPNQTLKIWLKRFNHISVREQSGIDICTQAGRNDAVCVVDPTMLLKADDYIKIANYLKHTEKYLFIYFLGTRTKINWKEIKHFAKKKKLKIVYVASQGQEDKFKHTEASIPQWLSLIAHAEYVITNSFHGTVFALLFGKKFMTYPVNGKAIKMNDRITTLLSPLSLRHHIYSKGLYAIEDNIDYTQVHNIMQNKASLGRKLLQEWTQEKKY